MSYDPEAADRVRRLLSGLSDVVEKKMVGDLSFLVNGNMCCGITSGALMVRVGAESREETLREPHVRPMLFAGRSLSGFVCVEPAGYAADDVLASWVQQALDYVSGLPGKACSHTQLTGSAVPADPGNLGPRSKYGDQSLRCQQQKRIALR